VVCWLLLSSAPAQADGSDDAPRADASTTKSEPAPRATAMVEKTTRAVTDTLRETPRRATHSRTHTTRSAPAPVRSTVADLTRAVEPTLVRTTDALAGSVDRTVTTVRSVVDPIVVATGLDAVGSAPVPVASPTHDGVTTVRGTGWLASDVSSSSAVVDAAAGGAADRSAAFATSRGVPAPHEPSVPAGSWSGPSGASATLAGMLLVLFLMLRGRRLRVDADLPAGPAYPPGSSPG
jgi:hypothetical protein